MRFLKRNTKLYLRTSFWELINKKISPSYIRITEFKNAFFFFSLESFQSTIQMQAHFP